MLHWCPEGCLVHPSNTALRYPPVLLSPAPLRRGVGKGHPEQCGREWLHAHKKHQQRRRDEVSCESGGATILCLVRWPMILVAIARIHNTAIKVVMIIPEPDRASRNSIGDLLKLLDVISSILSFVLWAYSQFRLHCSGRPFRR